jgi:ribose-phosphate pyrophosphokinase
VRAAGEHTGLQGVVCRKTRRGDRDVSVELPSQDITGRDVVVIDDVASTGHTIVQAAHALRERGVAAIDVAVVHALFGGDAIERLKQCGIRHVWSTDAVPHSSNVVTVAPLLARAIADCG